ISFFFFQAEDGIRDRNVTGVQTCALPIYLGMRLAAQLSHRLDHLREPAAVGGVVVAEPAAVGVERQLAHARDQVAVGHELAALRSEERRVGKEWRCRGAGCDEWKARTKQR